MSRNFRWMSVCCLSAFLLAAATGCGSGDPRNRQALSGKVTLGGQPLDQGIIEFSPEESGGMASGATIASGQYTIEREKVLPPGKYRVRLYSAGDVVKLPDGPPGPPAPGQPVVGEERIPPEYNMKSTQVVEVVSGGANAFDFDIRSKPK